MKWLSLTLNHLMVSAPLFVWLAAAVIIGLTIWQGIRLYFKVSRERKLYERFARSLRKLQEEYRSAGTVGLSEGGYEALRTMFENEAELRSVRNSYLTHLIPEQAADGHDFYWSESSASAAFSEATGFHSRINWKWFSAFPGFITGLGLLVTFVAILFALLDLRADPATGQITGITQLLEGLSGKFISSVAALICASIYLPFERAFLHRTEQGQQNLIDALDDFVPRLTPARILIALKRDTAEQADALRAMLTDLGPRLRQGLSESVGPTLERMVKAVEDLNQLTQAAEAQRQETMTDALRATLDQLSEGLQKTLGSLGEGFSQTLVGEAGRSFDRVLTSLEATSQLVERMNAQFEQNQAAMRALIDQARDSTSRQIELGTNQAEELSSLLRQMMERMSEATGSSVVQMNAALADAIKQMSATGQESNEQVAKLVRDLTAQIESSNGAVLARTKEDLNLVTDQVIGKIERFSEQIAQAVGRNEQATHASVKKILDESNELWPLLRQQIERVSEATGSSVGQMNAALTDAIKQMSAAGQESSERVAKLVGDLTAQIESSNGAVLARTKDDLNLVTDQVIGKIERFSEQIAQAVGRNEQATHASVKKILDETNELSRQNAERIASLLDRNQLQFERSEVLGGELNRLAEQLREALPEYSAVAKSLQAVATETSAAALLSKETAGSVQSTIETLRLVQGQVSEVAKHSANQVASIAAAVGQTRENMNEYARVFTQVKAQAAELLGLIDDRLQQQVAVSRDGYEAMSKAANELFTNAATHLGGFVESLTDSLDMLEERLRTMGNGRRAG